MKHTQTVCILGNGEIGKNMSKICKDGGYRVLVRDLEYDEVKGNSIDYLHVNIPETKTFKFIKIVSQTIKELHPKLTIINSSVSVGVTRKIYKHTHLPIVHSPVIGVHPELYKSIKFYFKKIIGPIDSISLSLAKNHFKKLGVKVQIYDSPENSEAAKLLDLVYYAWNIIYCKWVRELSTKLNLNFDQIYTQHNKIYNAGYRKLRPNVIRPILIPQPGQIGGHCTIPDTILFHKYYKSGLTKYILEENKRYKKE